MERYRDYESDKKISVNKEEPDADEALMEEEDEMREE